MRSSSHQLEAFAAVMRLGTATAAANVLNTSQPSITRAIRQLEDATRLLLFERREGRLQPTAEAFELLEAVEANFAGLDRIGHAAETILRRNRGEVRIGCLPAFAQGFMARAIAAFLDEEPPRHVCLLPMTARELQRAMGERKIDIGIIAFEVATSDDVSAERFTDMHEIALLPPRHRLADRRELSLRDLDGEAFVTVDAADPYRRRAQAIMRSAGALPRHTVETATSHGVGAMVAAGIGVGIVNPITALDLAGSGVTAVPIIEPLPFVTTLLTPRKPRPSRLVGRFIECLKRERSASLEKAKALWFQPASL